jgi:hypothetical protein
VPVVAQQGSKSYILCTLNAPAVLQQPLDLELNKGETVTFNLDGKGVVHLTGYYISEPDLDFPGEDAQEGNEEEESVDADGDALAKLLGNQDDDDEEEDEDDDDDGNFLR